MEVQAVLAGCSLNRWRTHTHSAFITGLNPNTGTNAPKNKHPESLLQTGKESRARQQSPCCGSAAAFVRAISR